MGDLSLEVIPLMWLANRPHHFQCAVNPAEPYALFSGFVHLAAGLSCGLTGLAAGYAIGIVGDHVSTVLWCGVAIYKSIAVSVRTSIRV